MRSPRPLVPPKQLHPVGRASTLLLGTPRRANVVKIPAGITPRSALGTIHVRQAVHVLAIPPHTMLGRPRLGLGGMFPPFIPSPNNTVVSITPRLISAKFGDGYRQDFGDGVGFVDRQHTVTWDPINKSDADMICQFLDGQVGVPFYYTLPRELGPRRWVWTGRQRSYPYPDQDALTVTLEERFTY